MNARRLVTYLLVTFGLSWGVWIPAGILTGSFAHGIESSPLMVGLVALGMFAPLVGAVVANALVGESDRLDLGLALRLRANKGSYLLAWLMPPVLTLLGSTLFFLLFPQFFDGSMTQARQLMEQEGVSSDLWGAMVAGQMAVALTLAPLVNALPACGEEVGWRSMLYPSLCEMLPARKAVLVAGLIWGVWHAPVTAMGHNYGQSYSGFPLVGVAAMVILCTAMGCLLSWLRERSGSVWPCALAHGAFNAVANTGVLFCTQGQTILGPSPAGLVAGIPLVMLAVACWRRMPRA